MKKFALVLALLLSLTIVFAACSNSTDTTNTSIRWRDETYVFNITKALLDGTDAVFNGETYATEPVASNYETNPESQDQLIPEDIAGTFVMTISVDETNKECTFTTVQTMYSQYRTSLLETVSIWNDLQSFVISTDSTEWQNAFALHDDSASNSELTTLKSVTEKTVTFKNEASQRPLSSETTVNGFYLGKLAQTISNYNVKTTYDWDNSTISVSKNGAEAVSNKVKISSSTKFIDSNQLLLYIRSLEKASTKFSDTPTVLVYEPSTNETATASFTFSYSCKTVLSVAGEDKYVTVNALAVIIDSRALFVQLNVPDSVNSNAALDRISNAGLSLDRFTTLRFRSGLIRYELSDYTQIANWSAILDAIETKETIDDTTDDSSATENN